MKKLSSGFPAGLLPVTILLLSLCAFISGCGNAPRSEYDLTGRVVSVNADREQVTLEHDAVPGYMDAMTMPFHVKDAWALSAMAPGQRVEARLVVEEDRSWIEDIRISGSEAPVQPEAAASVPVPGDTVPDFSLLNQDGQKIQLHQFYGRPLVLTFIYTRCPLPDYCPLMSGNFAALQHRIRSMPPSDSTPRLLTVSFDFKYDSPSVLRDYAARYMEPVRFDLWQFATGTEEEIKAITGYFGLVYREESDQIVHSLVTALIGPDGKLVRLYTGNQWRPEQILADLESMRDSKND